MISSEGCLFCGIVAGSIPATIVREDELTVAFHDIHPAAPIHILVIPRDHHVDVGDLQTADPELLAHVIQVTTEVARDQGVADGWRLVFNTGARSGQSVFHVHAHVLGYPGGTGSDGLSAHE